MKKQGPQYKGTERVYFENFKIAFFIRIWECHLRFVPPSFFLLFFEEFNLLLASFCQYRNIISHNVIECEDLMEKYYCDYCKQLYSEPIICEKCKTPVSKKIKIDVQHQSNTNWKSLYNE